MRRTKTLTTEQIKAKEARYDVHRIDTNHNNKIRIHYFIFDIFGINNTEKIYTEDGIYMYSNTFKTPERCYKRLIDIENGIFNLYGDN